MHLSLFIARRYLFAKKSRQVINIISWISAAGIALGTMALVIVLSVYNGFDNLVKGMFHSFDADLLVKPVEGKSFPYQEYFSQLSQDERVQAVCPIVEESVFLQYGDQQSIAIMKGVDSTFIAHSPLRDHVVNGEFDVYFGEVEEALVGRGLARTLGLNVHFIDPLWVYFPKRDAVYSPLNPMSSLRSAKLFPSGILAVEQNFDQQMILVPLTVARRLLDYSNEVSYIEIRTKSKASVRSLQKDISRELGPSFKVLNRYQQNETLYKMMTTEKMAIFMILGFIMLVISCNVLGSLSMLIIEKKEDVRILESMGARFRLIRQIFLMEGWLISILGLIAGLTLGLLICYLQIWFGIIRLPGNFVVENYPVDVQFLDVLLTCVTVLFLGFLAAYVPVRSVFRKDTSST